MIEEKNVDDVLKAAKLYGVKELCNLNPVDVLSSEIEINNEVIIFYFIMLTKI